MNLDEIKAREAAATPGPWSVETKIKFGIKLKGMTGYVGSKSDNDFVIHARTDIPALIKEVERLRAEIEQLREDNDET